MMIGDSENSKNGKWIFFLPKCLKVAPNYMERESYALGDVSHRFKSGYAVKWSWDMSWIRAGPGPLESASRLNHENSKLGFVIPGDFQRISCHVWNCPVDEES